MSDIRTDLLEYIKSYIVEHGYAPSIREMRDECGISSTSVVDYHLKKMVREGTIKKDDNKARAIVVL
jgi:repressor LexA